MPGLQQLGSRILRCKPKRLKFVAVLPGSDIGEMVKEARRAVDQLGACRCETRFYPLADGCMSLKMTALGAGLRIRLPDLRAWGVSRAIAFSHSESSRPGGAIGLQLASEGLDHALGFPCDNMAT